MAFVETSAWQAIHEGEAPTLRAALYLPPWLNLSFLGHFHWRRPAGMTLTIAMHILAIWILFTRTGIGPEGQGTGGSPGLTLIDLGKSDPVEAPSANDGAEASQSSASQQRKEETPSLARVPSEWSVTRIRIARATPSPAPQPATTVVASSATAGGTTGGGGGGGDVYDPYAGASPMRRGEQRTSGGGISPSSRPGLFDRVLNAVGLGNMTKPEPQIDEAMLERMRQAVRRRIPAVRGSIELTARVSPRGQVLDLVVRQENVGREALAQIRQELLGRALFHVAAETAEPATVDLPVLRF